MIIINIAYVRVSTAEQNETRQVEALKKYNVDKWFIEKISAKDTNRPQLNFMLDFCREGDTIYIHSLDRIARSTKDLLNIIDQLNNKKVNLISNKENIDTTTATGILFITMLGAIAEFERTNMLERQREGIVIAKAAGKFKGRKPIKCPENFEDVYNKWKNRKLTSNEAMEKLGLKRNTFYKFIKEYESAQST